MEATLVAAAVAWGDIVPIDLHRRARHVADFAGRLTARGWEVRDVDHTGISLSWPPSLLPPAEGARTMETPVTWLTLLLSGGGEYYLAGQAPGEPKHPLRWTHDVDPDHEMGRIEAHRDDRRS